MNYAPIAVFVYKRRAHLERTIESLRYNRHAASSLLYIFSDGPKRPEDAAAVEGVRDYCRRITGFKQLSFHPSATNKGLAQSIIQGVTSILQDHEKIIVLEDDMIVSPFFLEYMNDGLRLYETDDRVISIHAYSFPVKAELPETFFLRGADCWGWGTWRRGWSVFEPNGQKLLDDIIRRKLKTRFNFNDSFDYLKMLKRQIQGKIDSWAIRWYASAFLKDKLTLYPGKSLVMNIGLDSSGTHCTTASDILLSGVYDKQIIVGGVPVVENEQGLRAIQAFYRNARIKRILKKIIALPREILHHRKKS